MITANITAEHEFFVGTFKRLRFTFYGADDTTPVDPSGMSFVYVLEAAGVVLRKTTDDDEITFDGMEIVVEISAAESALFPPGICRHSLWRTDVGFEDVVADGTVELLSAATRASA